MPERLYRSRGDRILFGVAGGLARYLKIDPSIVRIVWVLLFFAAGTGIVLYIIAAVLIPEEPVGLAPVSAADPGVAAAGGLGTDRSADERRDTGGPAIVIGLILVLVGGWLLLQRFLPALDGRIVWPAILVVVGLALLLGSLRGRGRA